MISVRFRVNLGSVDAARLGIADFLACTAGAEVSVHESTAKALEAARLIEPLPVVQKAEARAQPAVDLVADPPPAVESRKKPTRPERRPE